MHVAAERVYRGAELNGNLVGRAVIENGRRQHQQALLEGPRRERAEVGKRHVSIRIRLGVKGHNKPKLL
jgi:hypothetical protein